MHRVGESVHNPWHVGKRAQALLHTLLCFGEVFCDACFARALRTLRVKAPDFAFTKLCACKAKQQPNRNPQLDNQNLTVGVSKRSWGKKKYFLNFGPD